MSTRYVCTRDLRQKCAPLVKTQFTSFADWRDATGAVADSFLVPPHNLLRLGGWRLADGSFVAMLYETEEGVRQASAIDRFARALIQT